MPQSVTDAGTAPSTEAAAPQQTRTPEQVEAEWSAKQAALGRQYAATERALREEIASLKASQQSAVETASGTQTEAEALRKQLADQEKRLQQREQEYTANLRATKYPLAAETLEPQVLATMDEARLAGLEARLTPHRPPMGIDSSTPPRTASAPKSPDEMSVEEMKAELERLAPAFAREIGSNY
jgi:septal ring factor EnvC (AmiA/AmiB activator)